MERWAKRAAERILVVVFCFLLTLLPARAKPQSDAISDRPAQEKLHILSVGINKYAHAPDLIFSTDDARSVGEAFAGVKQPAFDSVDVSCLLDEAANLDAVRSTFQRIAHNSSPDDVFLFFFSGRGAAYNERTTRSRAYTLQLHDTLMTGRDARSENGLTSFELSTLLLQIPARRQVVFLDSYDSAEAVEAIRQSLTISSKFSLDNLRRKVAIFGLEGGKLESSKWGHGLMTYALLRAMDGEADADHNGIITEAELEAYLLWKIPSIAEEQNTEVNLASFSNLRSLRLGVLDSTKAAEITRGVDLTPRAATSSDDFGKDYALIIAGNQYDFWPALVNPIFDAEILDAELKKNYGYQTDFRKNPDFSDVQGSLLGLYRRGFTKNDRLLIYIAGHGEFDRDTKMGYLVVKDTKTSNEDPLWRTFLSFSILRDLVNNLPAGHVLLVLDVCYGGTFDQRIAVSETRGDSEHQISRGELIKRKLEQPSRFYLTSGGKRSVYDGDPGRHSPFARLFLTLLRSYGGPERRVIDMDQIRDRLSMLDPAPMSAPFNPLILNQDFIFIPKYDATPVSDLSLP